MFSYSSEILGIFDPVAAALPWDQMDLRSQTEEISPATVDPGSCFDNWQWYIADP